MISFLSLMFSGAVIGLCTWYFLWKQSSWWVLKGLVAGVVVLALTRGIVGYVLPLLVTVVGYTIALALIVGAAIVAIGIWGRLFLRARAGG